MYIIYIYIQIYIYIYIQYTVISTLLILAYKAYTMYFHSNCTPNSVGTGEQQHHIFVGRETAAHRQGGATLR